MHLTSDRSNSRQAPAAHLLPAAAVNAAIKAIVAPSTSASQAEYGVSIPLTRSVENRSIRSAFP